MVSKKIQGITGHFFSRENIAAISPVTRGLINDTFLIEARRPALRYILQKINKQVFKDPKKVMSNLSRIITHLGNKPSDIQFPVLVKAKNDQLFHVDEQVDYWRVFQYIENTSTIDLIDHPRQAFEAAKAFGQFIRNLSDLNPDQVSETIDHFHDYEQRIKTYRKACEEDRHRRSSGCSREIEAINARIRYIDAFYALGLPNRVIHSDAKIDNVLFDNDRKKAKAVIDLDIAMSGSVLYDYGDMIRSYTNKIREDDPDTEKISIDHELFSRLTEGLLSEIHTVINHQEKENLLLGGKLVILIQAIRFLTDYLQGDIYYKTEYAAHNLIRTKNQLVLLMELEKDDEELNKIIKRLFNKYN